MTRSFGSRALMYESMGTVSSQLTTWRAVTGEVLRAELGSDHPEVMVYVIDADDGGLAACATGMVHRRLPSPTNPTTLAGHVSNVCTDTAYRRRGYARACMTGLLNWFATRGITRVDLRTSAEAEPLYESLGFRRTSDPAMRREIG